MTQNIEDLLNRYRDGECSAEECELVERFFLDHSAVTGPTLDKQSKRELDYRIRLNIQQATGVPMMPGRIIQLWRDYHRTIVAAVSVAAIISVSLLVYRGRTPVPVAFIGKKTISTGSNKAVLTLSNGKHIDLSLQQKNDTIHEPGALLTSSPGGRIVYKSQGLKLNVQSFNTINTPDGGQWQLILPDGTKVWLNAASRLTYPIVFNNKERKVELAGEAYFEVTHDPNKPFIVSSGTQRLRVLGTHFNISAYPEDPAIKSTLLSGNVQVSDTVSHVSGQLMPGMQSIISAGTIRLKTVEAEDAIDWQKGLFVFDSEKLGSVMRKLARWYGFRITFNNPADMQIPIGGSVSRFASIDKVLEKVSAVGHVHFEVQKDQVKVISNN